MTIKRGEVWLADLNPIRGSAQAGLRPVLIFQHDTINTFTTTVVTIPFTTDLRRAVLPSCVRVAAGDGGLSNDSVTLYHQLRVLDTTRLIRRLGSVSRPAMLAVERCALFTLGIV